MTTVPPRTTRRMVKLFTIGIGTVCSLFFSSACLAKEPSNQSAQLAPKRPFSVAQLSADSFPVPSSLNQPRNQSRQTQPSKTQFPAPVSADATPNKSGVLKPVVVDYRVTPLPPINSASTVLTPAKEPIAASSFPVPTRLEPSQNQSNQRMPAPPPQALAPNRPVPPNPPPSRSTQPNPTAAFPNIPQPASRPLRTPPVTAVAPPPTLAAPPVTRQPASAAPNVQPASVTALPRATNQNFRENPTPVKIPVPPPNPPAIVPNQRQTPSASTIARVRSSNLLPVPASRIPFGYTGNTQSISQFAPPSVNLEVAASSLTYSPIAGSRYRVVVQVNSSQEQAQLKSISPSAFRVFSDGQPVMQAGIFSERIRADELRSALTSYGLNAKVEELN